MQVDEVGTSPVDERFQRLEVLGEGTYGVVYKAQHRQTGQIVAMKRIRLDPHQDGVPSTAVREIALLKEMSHANIVRLFDVSCTASELHLVFEFVDNDLKRYMKTIGGPVPLPLLKLFVYQMVNGIAYCHSHCIIHRDLKPQNLLIDKNHKLKIADFGLARPLPPTKCGFTHEVVTLWYRAPEILLGQRRYTNAVDMWSIGCIIIEMATGRPLFPGDSEIDTLFQIFRLLGTPDERSWPGCSQLPDMKPTFPKWAPNLLPKLQSLLPTFESAGILFISQLLTYNCRQRLTALQALMHPWFHDIDKSQFEDF